MEVRIADAVIGERIQGLDIRYPELEDRLRGQGKLVCSFISTYGRLLKKSSQTNVSLNRCVCFFSSRSQVWA
jgi:hypothetical protein